MIDLPIIDVPTPSSTRAWRSEPHLNGEDGYAELAREEFLPGASERPNSSSRRHFLQILGASMAMAGLTACRRPVEHVMPFAERPEELIPGVPLYFATAMPSQGVLHPLLVKSHDGRPTKVEPNPRHPSGGHGTDVFAQASILNLYDPDRSQSLRRAASAATWDDFLLLCERISQGNRRVVVLSDENSSPTVRALRDQLLQNNDNAAWVTYRPEGNDHATGGLAAAYGQPLRAQYNF